ncbi:hypothetical protein [Xanthomonas arboricola]|uniref:hypothetical protein n=1 Tax=Xanthomonas arboricola TaxID=56448 RepID=UPI001AF3D988|nr:hypothetical protein [Xanthomonas arboricola]UOS97418.1 hypothetical protein LZZ50_12715 [Xanthomonas arboricola]CAD7381527.1 hypothetical protein X12_002270 [Xanthomonas arboricola]CAG2090693.1 hypothetical protein XCY_002269 [Xanthomonas arboricola pv. juglandis]
MLLDQFESYVGAGFIWHKANYVGTNYGTRMPDQSYKMGKAPGQASARDNSEDQSACFRLKQRKGAMG